MFRLCLSQTKGDEILMKKKVWIGLIALVLIFSIGTTAFALNSHGSFDRMLPFMKQMHPNSSDQQLEKMYRSCHSENGPMQQQG